jgi:diacylglycerol kinase (ATP)
VRKEIILLIVAVPLAFLTASDTWKRVASIATLMILLVVGLLKIGLRKLCDRMQPSLHDSIGDVRDPGSAAVLVSLVMTAMFWLTALWGRAEQVL